MRLGQQASGDFRSPPCIEFATFMEFIFFERCLTLGRGEIAPQELITVTGAKFTLELTDKILGDNVRCLHGFFFLSSAKRKADAHHGTGQCSARAAGARHTATKCSCQFGHKFRFDTLRLRKHGEHAFGTVKAV